MYTPHTDAEIKAMLEVIGVRNLEDLFQDVPEQFRFPELSLPATLSEMEIMAELQAIAQANETPGSLACFLGAGAYFHYTPAAVDAILRRGEFYTAYTPYQPEISQGTLQAIFEYQSLISALTGMDVCNASHYDGATATAEAGILAYHHYRGKRQKFLISPSINPQYRQTFCTYMCGYEDAHIIDFSNKEQPLSSPDILLKKLDMDTALVVVQYPDFFGRLYDYTQLANEVHQNGALLCIITNPLSLGLLRPPGEMGADIVVGEGQSLGIPLSFGGPYLGLFATRKDLIRRLAGRLVGETVDAEGRRGYVLTLTAREQHIRREKATSNICTNQGLIALASTIYMSLLGKHGLRKVSELCYHKAHYAAEQINHLPGYEVFFDTAFFNEFVVKCPIPVDELNMHLLDYGVLGGLNLANDFPSLENHMLVAVTEMNTREQIDLFCTALAEVTHD